MSTVFERVKIWTVGPFAAKEALDWFKSVGYYVGGLERFCQPRMDGNEVAFFGYDTGLVGFTESKSYFDNSSYTLLFSPKTELERPPIGLAPTYIWKALRVKDILAAMVRYHEAGKVIPDAWIAELRELQPKEGV